MIDWQITWCFFYKAFQKNHLMVMFSQKILSRLKSKAPKVFRAFWGGFPDHHHHLGNVNESPRWLSIESWLVNKGSLFHGVLLIAKKNWVVESSVQCFWQQITRVGILVCAHLIMGKPCAHSLHLWYQIMIGFCYFPLGKITQSILPKSEFWDPK